ncbi:MAG: sulfur oxidation c-type cytochrome SoxX [Rhodanobacter sp.]|jgi:sulfur-oxidizing protein SoxX|nr:sulfur oxidation c-type cytochrome SoxX [Rhodanobacter sp.]
MHSLIRLVILLAAVPVVSGAAVHATQPDRNAQALSVMKTSFQAKGQAGMDRLNQDKTQALCSLHAPAAPPAEPTAKVVAANLASIKLPADGKFLGDWKRGQAIAEEGTGEQYSDDPAKPSGGNCYACHELDKQQIAYGTIGPSLYRYGKNRGSSEPILKLTWDMLYDMKGYAVCTAMPRFGSKGILTEQQIKDVMALLFDPDSPVNK